MWYFYKNRTLFRCWPMNESQRALADPKTVCHSPASKYFRACAFDLKMSHVTLDETTTGEYNEHKKHSSWLIYEFLINVRGAKTAPHVLTILQTIIDFFFHSKPLKCRHFFHLPILFSCKIQLRHILYSRQFSYKLANLFEWRKQNNKIVVRLNRNLWINRRHKQKCIAHVSLVIFSEIR